MPLRVFLVQKCTDATTPHANERFELPFEDQNFIFGSSPNNTRIYALLKNQAIIMINEGVMPLRVFLVKRQLICNYYALFIIHLVYSSSSSSVIYQLALPIGAEYLSTFHSFINCCPNLDDMAVTTLSVAKCCREGWLEQKPRCRDVRNSL